MGERSCNTPSLARAVLHGAAQTLWDYHVDILDYLAGEVKGRIKPKLRMHSDRSRTGGFLSVRLYKRYVLPIWKRAIHAPSEAVRPLPYVDKRQTVRYVVQLHHAKRAGPHYDLRFIVNGRGISFAIPKHRMPKDGQNLLAVLQPDHVEEYFGFEGVIPDKQKGAGLVEIVAKGEMDILECSPEKVVFHIWDGPKEFQGRFVLVNTDSSGPNDWLFRRFEPKFEQVKKHSFKTWNKGPFEDILRRIQAENRLAELKVDGSHEIVVVDKHGRVFLLSHRISERDGMVIDHTAKLPQLHDDIQQSVDSLGLRNCVLHGEVYHPRGASFMSGILNATPMNARRVQAAAGGARIAFFDAGRVDGKWQHDVPYTERFEFLRQFALAGGPRTDVVDQIMPGEDIVEFAERVRSNSKIPNDGIIGKDPNAGYKGEVIVRAKDIIEADCVIVKVNEGDGALAEHVGSFTVRDEHGKLINVGTFPGKPREYQALLWDIRDDLPGQTIQVAFHDRSGGLTRTGPRFIRFHPGKSSAPLFERTKGMDEENWHDLAYAMKSSAGWRQ